MNHDETFLKTLGFGIKQYDIMRYNIICLQ